MAAKGPKGCLNACCAMTRHLLALIALGAAGVAACDMCSVHCDGCEMLEPTCSGFSSRVEDRWREWQEFGSLCEKDVCCASDEEDCCEPNVVAISFLVFALADVVFLVWLCIYKEGKCKGWKLKEPDEEARHGDSSEPDVAPQRAAEPETEAEAEEPGFVGKLAWYLFGEDEPAVESESVAVEVEEPVAESEDVVVEVEPPAMWEQEELEPES